MTAPYTQTYYTVITDDDYRPLPEEIMDYATPAQEEAMQAEYESIDTTPLVISKEAFRTDCQDWIIGEDTDELYEALVNALEERDTQKMLAQIGTGESGTGMGLGLTWRLAYIGRHVLLSAMKNGLASKYNGKDYDLVMERKQ